MNKVMSCLLIFTSGMVVANNLSRLIGSNPGYEAEWWKVGLALFMAIAASIYASRQTT